MVPYVIYRPAITVTTEGSLKKKTLFGERFRINDDRAFHLTARQLKKRERKSNLRSSDFIHSRLETDD